MYWYTLHVKPHKERLVASYLKSNCVDIYLPTIRVKPANPRAAKVRPYFPGYLFVQADLEQEGQSVFRWVPGAHGLVRLGGEPAMVPAKVVATLKEKLGQLPVLVTGQDRPFAERDRVRIVDGPFAGYEAIFDAYLPAEDRVQVLLSFLSKHPQRLQLEKGAIRPGKRRK